MKRMTKYYKRVAATSLKVAVVVIFLNIITMPTLCMFHKDENNLRHVFLNGDEIGYVDKDTDLNGVLADARRMIAKGNEDTIYADADLTFETSTVVFGRIDSRSVIRDRMAESLKAHVHQNRRHAYTVKIGDYMVNLAGSDEVRQVLQAALDVYQDDDAYVAQLVSDPTRELNTLTAVVISTEEKTDDDGEEPVKRAGFESFLEDSLAEVDLADDVKSFEDFEYGLQSMTFGDKVEIVDAYLTDDQITSVDEAITEVTSVQEVNSIYEVQAGDTLSQIAENTNIPMDKIISLNENLENELSMIRAGDELIITMPEPPLSIERVEQEYVEEYYDAEIQYVDNDDWYTTDQVTLQEPSAGRRNIVAQISYRNEKEVDRTVIKEEVLLEAVPKIVERGTKIPPSYIKPISGGRLSSGFGGRKAPTRGASTYHQGIDWATPVGTAVYASSGGTVTKAGWGSGYGNVIYIKHPDGRETRYGHLSKCLVSAGTVVKQGQKIALSGNTGRSTGPHIHFEIRINGSAVNPLKYLN